MRSTPTCLLALADSGEKWAGHKPHQRHHHCQRHPRLANHLKKVHGAPEEGRLHRVAIACDSRHRSQEFAQITAEVLAANGFEAWMYPELRPTPQLSWTVRVNSVPWAAWWSRPVTTHLSTTVTKFTVQMARRLWHLKMRSWWPKFAPLGSDEDVPRSTSGIHVLDHTWDERFRAMLASFRLSPHLVEHGSDLPVVFTGLHGTGALAVPPALEAFGFRNVMEVASQAIPDGAFPTVASPNPEEAPALAEAVALAREQNASLVMGTDPDSDRVGLAVPDGTRGFCVAQRQRNSRPVDRPRPVEVAGIWKAGPTVVCGQNRGHHQSVGRIWPNTTAWKCAKRSRDSSTSQKPSGKRRANVSTWLAAKRATATSWAIKFATRMRCKAVACSPNWPMSWTNVANACWTGWSSFIGVTAPTKKGWFRW